MPAVGMALAGAAQVAAAAPASAHVQVVDSAPPDGGRLASGPGTVTLHFDGPVRLNPDSVRVATAPAGARVDDGHPFHPLGRPDQVAVRLGDDLPPAAYAVTFGLLSDDGHPVSGVITFVVGDGPQLGADGAPVDGRGADPLVAGGYAVTRWLAFAGPVGLGGLLFVVTCWPGGGQDRRTRRLLGGCAVTAAAGTLGSLLLQGPYGSRGGIDEALSPDLLAVSLDLPVGRLLVLRLGLLAVLGALAPVVLRDAGAAGNGSPARTATMVLGVPLLACYAGAGHAGGGDQPTVMVISTLLHLAAMGLWLGGLAVLRLAVLPRRVPAELARVLPPFSRLAACCVVVLTVTGCYQAVRQLNGPADLWGTGYGRVLAVKLVAVAAVLLLAGAARRAWWRRLPAPPVLAAAVAGRSVPGPRVAGTGSAAPGTTPAPDQRSVAALARMAGLELAAATAVLALSAVLMSATPAPRL